jgi:tetratricopeptide (TPR) repeat protein
MPPATETPRDLLFGLLALQVGLIDQDQLVAAFGAWTRTKGQLLAEILVARGSIDAAGRSALEAMVDVQLRKHGGDPERSLASITVGPSTRQKLAALGETDLTATLAHVRDQSETLEAPGGATATMSIGTATSDGQRFRVLRPHAQGGLGAVFVALDGELNREVALKQILDHYADDPQSRTRFLIEAEITGGLEHPGIVPVYGLGHYGDGRPYYAMRFIRGDSLKEAIASFHADPASRVDPGKRSLALRKLLRRFVDVCNAIDYAHGRGVLHRDLKPGNVIVGKYGETLVVDWGLAKALGRSEVGSPSDERTLMPLSSSGSAETLPGSAIGTPAFMSPEQALGELDRLGPRSDVYSLGATLYSVLTGKAPFEKGDLGTLLRAVQRGEFPPPRQLDPTIDRALEAVCLKAMALKPEDRHASARALADDVERWTADEPVSAWREPWSRRVRRWMRRHRTAMTAASAAVLMAMVGLLSVLTVQSKANRDLQGKNAELADANGRVQARFELARDAIRAFQAGVNEDEMLKGAELEGLRNKLLRSAAGFYERLEKLLEGQTDRASRSILAQSYTELGELIAKIGVQPEALAAHRKALAIRRELAASGADIGTRLDLVRTLISVGDLAEKTGDPSGARAAFEEALRMAEATAAVDASDDSQATLASSHEMLGGFLSHNDQKEKALESLSRALAIAGALARANPGVTRFQAALAENQSRIGHIQRDTGRLAEASLSYRAARDGFESLAKANPANTRFQTELAYAHASLGDLQNKTGHPDEWLASYLRVRTIHEGLVKANPAVTQFKDDLAAAEASIASAQLATGRPADALASNGRALAIRESLAKANPAVIRFQRAEAATLMDLGWTQSRIGRSAEALATSLRAVKLLEQLENDHPSRPDLQFDLGEDHLSIGQLHYESGIAKEGLRSTRLGLAMIEKAVQADPSNLNYRLGLAIGHMNLGANRSRTDPSGAMESFERSQSLFEKLAKDNPTITECRDGIGNAHLNIGHIDQMTGHPDKAMAAYGRALQVYETLATANPAVTHYQEMRSKVLINLAALQRLAGRSGEASANFAQARSTLERLVESNPQSPKYRQLLLNTLFESANQAVASGKQFEAVALYRRMIAILSLLPEDAPTLYDLTCARSRLASLADQPGSGVTALEGRAEGDRAVSTFAKAIKAGYANLAHCQTDSDLDPIRSRPDFQLLMMDLAFPSNPFNTAG